jgi:hypothetical protein
MADTIAEQADALKVAYQSALTKIQTDVTLSTAGKNIQIAAAYISVKDRLDALNATQSNTSQTLADTLERSVFGLPTSATSTDITSYRDAFDRLSTVDPSDPATARTITTMLDNAKRSGDSILTKAVLSYAFDTKDTDVINRIILDNPTWEANVEALWSIKTAPTDLLASWQFIVTRPTELQSMDEYSIRVLAKSNPGTTADSQAYPAAPYTTASY